MELWSETTAIYTGYKQDQPMFAVQQRFNTSESRNEDTEYASGVQLKS